VPLGKVSLPRWCETITSVDTFTSIYNPTHNFELGGVAKDPRVFSLAVTIVGAIATTASKIVIIAIHVASIFSYKPCMV